VVVRISALGEHAGRQRPANIVGHPSRIRNDVRCVVGRGAAVDISGPSDPLKYGSTVWITERRQFRDEVIGISLAADDT